MGQIEQSLSAIRVSKGRLEMLAGGPRFQEIMGKPAPFCQWRKRPSFPTQIEAKDTIFRIPFPSWFHGAKKWATLSNSYPRLVFGKGRPDMAMGGLWFQKILANPRTGGRCPKRPNFRALIAARGALFLTQISSFFHLG